ncbi:hybrid sensor histidine kinase/response regulator [Sediminispirochaeta smaragdinae]|uniref:histidine kinase n=1 Tax=Sediminispirochaeta smaragdinae (strain DSM 11293 / JCM 15392 / SEBR 4228) TaxID=573413 RepID=E1R9B3_SEDSS|nr:hybrid sensor histidine kinase/response regulator [Sediminispirochaeta smaragdinae]ADK83082.1 response regulator receiver sensor signal transduction histidine kinase [Sediminispirochaeta smaragdinae DSM 11293]
MDDEYQSSRILIVDDVYRNIQLAGAILKQENFHFSFATDGNTALRVAREGGVDLILLDIMMPDLDGFSVCSLLKENPETADIPVIFLTAKNDTESIVRGFDLGAVDYLTKPFQAAELLARVRTHVHLRITERKLKEANAAKDRFFSIIAHDLRSPFTALLGVSQYLRDGIDELSPETAKELIGGIHTASKNAFDLLENLLQWSRVQTGTAVFVPEDVELASSVRDNIGLLGVNIAAKELSVENKVPENIRAYADARVVDTVIRNLLSNAVKFTPRGGRVELIGEENGKDCRLIVRDSGVGMSEKQLASLFKIDSRQNTKGTEQEEGSGLGLILSKEFLDRSNGYLSVESRPGEGSVFTVTLPAFS